MEYITSDVVSKSWNDKNFTESTLTDKNGQAFEKVSDWSGSITGDNMTVEGEIIKNDKGYLRFQAAKKAGAGGGFGAKRIEEMQEKKAKSIEAAQDRSAWMWAKNNAADLVAKHPAFKDLYMTDVLPTVEKLATKIYNLEPIEPF